MEEICAPDGIFDLWCLAVGRARLLKVCVCRELMKNVTKAANSRRPLMLRVIWAPAM